jgi:hypothetical protein
MKYLLFALILATLTLSQPGTLLGSASRFGNGGVVYTPPAALPGSSGPSSDQPMDTSSSDSANVGASSSSASNNKAYMVSAAPTYSAYNVASNTASSTSSNYVSGAANNEFDNANNAWSYMQNLGGGCCNSCNKFCGLAIKIYGSNYYLTKVNAWFQFQYTTSPSSSQIFTIGQNSDCTWSISNGGAYLSTTSAYAGSWVGPVTSIGLNERWYIERSGSYVYVQNANSQYYYWRASAAPTYYLGYSYASGTRLAFEYYPCDKTYGWNW